MDSIAHLAQEDASFLCRPVTLCEIEEAIRHSSSHKSPGPDGFNAQFFKICWLLIGNDISAAILEFVEHGKLLKQIKHTFITLIPKSEVTSSPSDYRPISLTNELYRFISRIIRNRLKGIMGKLISQNQSAFIPGRSISDNILLCHDLMHSSHLQKGP